MYDYWHRLRVRYQETDQMGVVYHANYLTWFEMARTEWVRRLGYPYSRLEELGLLLPVTDAQVKYRQPARYDDLVEVGVRVAECTSLRIAFEYCAVRAAEDADGQASEASVERTERQAGDEGPRDAPDSERPVLVTGTTRHVWLNRDWKPVRIDRIVPELHELISNRLK